MRDTTRSCLIGVTAATEKASYGVWNQLIDLAPAGYALTVRRSGGFALLLPTDPAITADPLPLLNRLDGLILAGGADLDPGSYGVEPGPHTADTRPNRDEFELSLTKGALELDLPLLGICRGFQVINVAVGGTLQQHLPDVVGHEGHRTVPGQFDRHEVELSESSDIARICGARRISVYSHHHQGLDRIGSGLEVTGVAIPDRIPEAFEVTANSFALGVQWHPEVDRDNSLVSALVDAASGRMER